MDPLKIHFLFKMGIFHCYVSLPDGIIDFAGVFFFAASFKHPQPTATTAPLRLRYSQSATEAEAAAVWDVWRRMQKFCWEKPWMRKRSASTFQSGCQLNLKGWWIDTFLATIWHPFEGAGGGVFVGNVFLNCLFALVKIRFLSFNFCELGRCVFLKLSFQKVTHLFNT